MTVITLFKKKKKDYQTDVEIKLYMYVAVNLSGKRLTSAGRPCKRKSWFDHNVIIRGLMYMRVAKFRYRKTSAQPYRDTHMHARILE